MTAPTLWYGGQTHPLDEGRLASTLEDLRNQAGALGSLGVTRRVEVVAEAARRWLTGEDRRRDEQVQRAPSPAIFAQGLDTTLQTWSEPRELCQWLGRDIGIGSPDALESWQPCTGGERRFFPPSLLVHVQAGNVEAPGLEGVVAAVLVGAPILVKVASSDQGLVEAFCATLVEIEPTLAACLAVARWPGGTLSLERLALSRAEVVLFHGGDTALTALTPLISPPTRLVSHPHRFSFAYVAGDIDLDEALLHGLALDVASYDQQGCLSPQILYIEGDLDRTNQVGQGLARAFEAMNEKLPPAPRSLEQQVDIVQLKGRVGFTGRVWSGPGWTLTLEDSPRLPSPGGRTLLMSRVQHLEEALTHLGPMLPRVQGVSLGAGASFGGLSMILAQRGVSMISRPGSLQMPPTGWPADGRLLLSDLVRWVWRSA